MDAGGWILLIAGIVVTAILAIIVIPNIGNPLFWGNVLKAILLQLIPILGKRGTPEQEDEANKNYRRGGDGNIPLPYKRPGQRKSIFDFFRKEK